jgi:hypothetical protein
MTPHEAFQRIIAQQPQRSFRDCWVDFAFWEEGRGYSDDPSAPSKTTIEWILHLDELAIGLNDFGGPTRGQCQQMIEQLFEAFAQLDHSDEICRAIQKWLEFHFPAAAASSEGPGDST